MHATESSDCPKWDQQAFIIMALVWDGQQEGQNRTTYRNKLIFKTWGDGGLFPKVRICSIVCRAFSSCTYWIHHFCTLCLSELHGQRGTKILQDLQEQAENVAALLKSFSGFVEQQLVIVGTAKKAKCMLHLFTILHIFQKGLLEQDALLCSLELVSPFELCRIPLEDKPLQTAELPYFPWRSAGQSLLHTGQV